MEKIFSRIRTDQHPDFPLHVIVRKSDFITGRQDIISPWHFIQCSTLNLNKGKTFKPHKHIWKDGSKSAIIAQESWVVLQGKVKCLFYDIDDVLLGEWILEAGDASFTLDGGHNYEVLEDNTLVYEFKTGPYYGQELDKKFI